MNQYFCLVFFLSLNVWRLGGSFRVVVVAVIRLGDEMSEVIDEYVCTGQYWC